MTLSQTRLAGTQVLVEGSDARGNYGQEILDASQWDDVKRRTQFVSALDAVDDAIAEFVKPLQDAIDKANAVVQRPELDPLFYVVESEGVEGVEAQPRIVTKLGRDATILRAIEQGHLDRVIWINGQLALTAVPLVPVPASSPTVNDPSVAYGDASSATAE